VVCGPEPPEDELDEDEGLPDDCDDDPPDDDDGDEDDEPPDDDGDCELEDDPPEEPLDPLELLELDELGIGMGIDGLGIELLGLVVAQPPVVSAAASRVSPARPVDRCINPLMNSRQRRQTDSGPETTAYPWIRRTALGSNISAYQLLQPHSLYRRVTLRPTRWGESWRGPASPSSCHRPLGTTAAGCSGDHTPPVARA